MKAQLQINGIENFNDSLGFGYISLDDDYRKKWNISLNDYVLLLKNGEPIRNTLYRVGGRVKPNLENDKYLLLLKYVESFYDDTITKDKKRKSHLSGRWCIIDEFGNEMVEFKPFESPYLVKNSVLYTINGHYYNITDGYDYGNPSSVVESNEYLFLQNDYDKDKSKRGVIKIKKSDGSFEIIK